MSNSIYRLNLLFRGENGDQKIDDFIAFLSNGTIPEGQTQYKMAKKTTGFKVQNDQLFHGTRQVIPSGIRPDILRQAYENDARVHGKGIVLLYKLFTQHYLNITRDDIAKFLHQNAEYNIGKQAGHRVNKPIISLHPNSLWGLDLIDCSPYVQPNRWWRYIMTVVDIFSRYTWLARLKTKEAADVAAAFHAITVRAGVRPDSLMSDNGGEFQGEFSQMLDELGIKHRKIRSHTPEANGVVERRNQEVRKIIRSHMLANKNRIWYDKLPDVERALNSSYISTIKNTPESVWTADKTRLTQRDLPPAVVDQNPKLKARLGVLLQAQAQIRKFRAHDYEEGDHVRVKMATLFSQIRAMVKAQQTKLIVVVHSPDLFVIDKVVRVQKTTLERRRYTLRHLNTGHVVQGANGNTHQFYSSDLIEADPADPGEITMDQALRLNNASRSATDLVF